MDSNKPDKSQPMPRKDRQSQQPGQDERVTPRPTDRSKADDRGTIPPLPEPEVEGVGNEGRGNNLQQNPSRRSQK